MSDHYLYPLLFEPWNTALYKIIISTTGKYTVAWMVTLKIMDHIVYHNKQYHKKVHLHLNLWIQK